MTVPTTDRRSPLARARDDFLASECGKRLTNVHTLKAPAEMAQYLENRITTAFLAGVAAARDIPEGNR